MSLCTCKPTNDYEVDKTGCREHDTTLHAMIRERPFANIEEFTGVKIHYITHLPKYCHFCPNQPTRMIRFVWNEKSYFICETCRVYLESAL